MAAALADGGEYDRAEAVARTVTDPDEQAGVLVTLALAAQGDETRSRQLVAEL